MHIAMMDIIWRAAFIIITPIYVYIYYTLKIVRFKSIIILFTAINNYGDDKMDLNKINGNTYYIDNPTNIGVYTFKNKYCVMIDTGINNTLAAKFDEVLSRNGIKPKYVINTHCHVDHAGANFYFKEHHPGIIFYSTCEGKIYLENDYLFPSSIYGTGPAKENIRPHGRSKAIDIDQVMEYGMNKINDEKFDIIPLDGHAIGQIGIATPDRVLFLGDSLFSPSIMGKYTFPLLYDVEAQLKTIDYIKDLDYKFYILSHGDKIYDTHEIRELADKNRENIEMYLDDIKELLNQPLSKEDVLEQICQLNDMALDFRSYHLCLSSVGAFMTYIFDKKMLEYEVENGKLYYYLKL
jgi:glyoxylase-like metal-dependent hydrolase (beta-lactamase superfamily II)